MTVVIVQWHGGVQIKRGGRTRDSGASSVCDDLFTVLVDDIIQICVENRVLDIYINGVMTKRMDLESIPRHNFSDVFVCQNGGFQGSLSDLRYFNKSLNVFEINGIVGSGPNLSTSADADKAYNSSYYLSSNWYSSNK